MDSPHYDPLYEIEQKTLIDEEYMIFDTLDEITKYTGTENNLETRTNNIIFRNEKTNDFYLFKDHNAATTFFEENIKNKPMSERIYHLL